MKKKQPGPPVMSIKSASGIRYLPKIQKDKNGNWQISNPEGIKSMMERPKPKSGKR